MNSYIFYFLISKFLLLKIVEFSKNNKNVKVLSWGNEKLTCSYTYIIEHLIKQKRIDNYKKIWSNYKDKGRLINFWKFNDEDKNIKQKSWYNEI